MLKRITQSTGGNTERTKEWKKCSQIILGGKKNNTEHTGKHRAHRGMEEVFANYSRWKKELHRAHRGMEEVFANYSPCKKELHRAHGETQSAQRNGRSIRKLFSVEKRITQSTQRKHRAHRGMEEVFANYSRWKKELHRAIGETQSALRNGRSVRKLFSVEKRITQSTQGNTVCAEGRRKCSQIILGGKKNNTEHTGKHRVRRGKEEVFANYSWWKKE